MQKEQYETLEIETIEFDTEDVIRTSPAGGKPGDGWDQYGDED